MRPDAPLAEKRARSALRREEIAYIGRELLRLLPCLERENDIDRNPARVTGWQRQYQIAEDELDDPRSLALPAWESLMLLARALVNRSWDRFEGWGDVVVFAACTAARIGEVSGVRASDIDPATWMWTVRRQATGGVDQMTTMPMNAIRPPTWVTRLATTHTCRDGGI